MQIQRPAVSVRLQLLPSFASISFPFVIVLLGMSYSLPRKPVTILVLMLAERSGSRCNVLVQGDSSLIVVNYQLPLWLKVISYNIEVADFQSDILINKT